MDDEENARLQTWLETCWKHGSCPVCKHNEWSVNPKIGQIFNENSYRLGGTAYPVLLITCDTCGYTLTINAIIAGIRSGEQRADEDTPNIEPTETDSA